MTPDSTQRFSNRVGHYVMFRPGYPREFVPFLAQAIALTPAWTVADIGSGTGISTELFLNHGNEVFAIEPNPDMRAAAERALAAYPKFHSISGAAASTGLVTGSVDLVTCFQAFHWFDRDAARREFSRILKPGGWALLVWNDRKTDATPFLQEYERLLLEHGTDYARVRHSNVSPEDLSAFFDSSAYRQHVLPNEQVFDLAGLKGRLMSSSYAPAEGQPGFAPMMAELERIFDKHQQSGRVSFLYDTRLYFGQLK